MRTTIIPGLVVDEAQFEAAASGLVRWAPQVPLLTWEQFTDPLRWTLVPDDAGCGYKAEFVAVRTPDLTVKVNQWTLPDRRGGDAPKPHNHPWAFTAHILLGGYTEDRYQVSGRGIVERTDIHCAGGTNDVPVDLYHEVTDIHDPGATLTLMVCGAGRKADWGYLDLRGGGGHIPTAPDPLFAAKLAALNPQHRGSAG